MEILQEVFNLGRKIMLCKNQTVRTQDVSIFTKEQPYVCIDQQIRVKLCVTNVQILL